MKKLIKYFRHVLVRVTSFPKFQTSFLATLPSAFHPAAKFLFTPLFSKEERQIAQQIEAFRSKIPRLAAQPKILTYTSPHSGTFEKDDKGHAKSGDKVESDVKNQLKVGSHQIKGILLRRIVAGYGAKNILELGTNTGFSGAYFLSIEGTNLVTIEGSEELCQIADQNMSRISKNYRIMPMLFEEAIDTLTEEKAQFDCVFIDGQHEKEATLHYATRVKPLMKANALYIFDDIYWSEGMNDAWKTLIADTHYSYAVDLSYVGLCIQEAGNNSQNSPILYDMGKYTPRPEIFRKGW